MKTLKNIWVVVLIMLLLGCGKEDEDKKYVNAYVDTAETVKILNPYAYGPFLEGTGSDDDAWRQVNERGWSIYQEHRGGYGDTLQITKGGVILIWAYNVFNGFTLTHGWAGATERGIRIGSSLQEFLNAYQEAIRDVSIPEARVYTIKDNREIEAVFDEKGTLRFLNAGFGVKGYYLSGDPLYDPSFLDLGMFGLGLPGSWQESIDIPGYTKVYQIEIPYRYDRLDIKQADRIKIGIKVVSQGLQPFCVDIVYLNSFEQELSRDGELCASDTLDRIGVFSPYYDEYNNKWRFGQLAVTVRGESFGAIGNYELSLECPSGVNNENNQRSFCVIE